MPGSSAVGQGVPEEGEAAHHDPRADQRRRHCGEQTAEQRPLREVRGERVGEEVDRVHDSPSAISWALARIMAT